MWEGSSFLQSSSYGFMQFPMSQHIWGISLMQMLPSPLFDARCSMLHQSTFIFSPAREEDITFLTMLSTSSQSSVGTFIGLTPK